MIELLDTNASEISSAFVEHRTRHGSPAQGMVMTMVIVAVEDGAKE
ncbi:MAG: Oxidoreductase, partial [Nocardioides sp.]|nr:Oxidoreductase [Nocardioides sp.]